MKFSIAALLLGASLADEIPQCENIQEGVNDESAMQEFLSDNQLTQVDQPLEENEEVEEDQDIQEELDEEEEEIPEDTEEVQESESAQAKGWGRRVCQNFYLKVRNAKQSRYFVKRLPRCVKGRAVYIWQGRGRCNFIGGALRYQTRHLCAHGHNAQFRRITRCKWFLPRNTYFHSNVPVGGMSLHRYKSSVRKYRGGNRIMNFGSGWMYWYGSRINRFPDRNFEISFWFRTAQHQVGLFEIISVHGRGGWDREIGLKFGKPYIRVWKGAGWVAHTFKHYNDNRWHHLRLRVKNHIGQQLYMDGHGVAAYRYDHSDFTWKNALRIGYAIDLRVALRGQMQQVVYKRV